MNFEELSDLCTPWCVHVVATLHIADHIAAGNTHIDNLAALSGADRDSLCRVLRHLVNMACSKSHRPAASRSMRLPARCWTSRSASASISTALAAHGSRWGTLLSAVRTGRRAYHEAFGRGFWDDLDAHPNITAGVADRATSVAQSFFDPLPAGRDLYILKSVLHDWPDRQAAAILARCAEAARLSGRAVVFIGAGASEDASPALPMMVLVGGRECLAIHKRRNQWRLECSQA